YGHVGRSASASTRMNIDIGPTFSRRRLASGLAAIFAFPTVRAFAVAKRFAGGLLPNNFLAQGISTIAADRLPLPLAYSSPTHNQTGCRVAASVMGQHSAARAMRARVARRPHAVGSPN